MELRIKLSEHMVALVEKTNTDATEKNWASAADVSAKSLSGYNTLAPGKRTAFALSKPTGLVMMTAALIGLQVMAQCNDQLNAEEKEEPDKENGKDES